MIAIMLLISDDTLFITNFFAVDICIDNVVDVEVDLEFGPYCLVFLFWQNATDDQCLH